MAVHGEKINVLIPDGMMTEIRDAINREKRWISVQEFIRQAVGEKLDRMKERSSNAE